MRFFFGICLLAVIGCTFGYRVARDTHSSDSSHSHEHKWTDEQEKQAIQYLTQYCKSVSGVDDAVMKIKDGAEKLFECVTHIYDPKEIETKVKNTVKADQTEDMKEVFQEYCPKLEDAMHCINEFTPILAMCFDAEDMEAINLVFGIIKRLSKFVCHNNGEYIVQFIADDGVQCITDHESEFHTCWDEAKTKYTNRLKADIEDNDNDLDLKMTKDDCIEFDHQHTCLVNLLKAKCTKQSISEIVDTLFNEIKKETKCDILQH